MKANYYFDNTATWPRPEAVYTFMDRFYRDYGVNPGRGGYELAMKADTVVTETRAMLTEFFGCDGPAERLIFTANATDSLNTVLFGLLHEVDHVVTTRISTTP
jgi:cysteine desulfurase/selenocysteine lyase